MNDWHWLREFWPHIVAVFTLIVLLGASAHVVLNKRDVRSAISWVGLIWLAPLIGALLYTLFGINRIRRRATELRQDVPTQPMPYETAHHAIPSEQSILHHDHLRELVRLVGQIGARPLLHGNRVEPLVDPETAYAAMIQAIDAAEHSVSLVTYIFNRDAAGERFVTSLANAMARGVQVRVLIDDIGARYNWPTIVPVLRKAKVPVARFMPTLVPGWFAYFNLRTHRKIMVVDGRIGFTGGMNIRDPAAVVTNGVPSMHDLHFKLAGPVVAQLQEVFAEDWAFSTREALTGSAWFPPLEPVGSALARGISIGPDEDWDKLRLVLLGALGCAEKSVRIMTPYFLPDSALLMAMNIAAMRGLRIEIVLPKNNNLRMVQRACTAQLWQVLEHGCRVWYTNGPFDHSKLMVVDGAWSLFGSANWDARSLRLNFEFNVECYDVELAERLEALIDAKLQGAEEVTLAQVDGRSLPVRLRDGVIRLFTPYL